MKNIYAFAVPREGVENVTFETAFKLNYPDVKKIPKKPICVSISSSPNYPVLSIKEKGYVDFIRVAFEDIDIGRFLNGPKWTHWTPEQKYEELDRNYILFKQQHAYQIFKFIDKYINKTDCIVVHCDAGVSRSPAVVFYIQEVYKNKNIMISKETLSCQHFKNKTVYEGLVNQYEKRKGKR